MSDQTLFYFWAVCFGMFTFATVYSFFLARIARNILAREIIWLFAAMMGITGINTMIRSGNDLFEPEHLIIISRTAFFMGGVTSVWFCILMARFFNEGKPKQHRTIKAQLRDLWQDLTTPTHIPGGYYNYGPRAGDDQQHDSGNGDRTIQGRYSFGSFHGVDKPNRHPTDAMGDIRRRGG